MAKGLHTPLYKDFDEDGVEISGGEAQKIALARALYKEAPFIVLDEPTAALDPISEYEIYTRFNEIVGDKTAVLFPTGFPPAASAMILLFLTKANSFSAEATMCCWLMKKGNTMSSGTHKLNITHKKQHTI